MVKNRIIFGMGITVSNQKIENDQSDKAKSVNSRQMHLIHSLYAILNAWTAVLLIFQFRRYIQDLTKILRAGAW